MAEGSPGVLLGRPFLSTASTVIDVRNGTMDLSFHGERLTFSINEAERKSQDSEDKQSVEIAQPQVREDEKKEFSGRTTVDPLAEEMNKKEAAKWTDVPITGGMDDEIVEKVIIDFCKPLTDADQGASVGRMLGDSPAPAKQLTSIPALQITPQSKFTPTHQRQGEPGLSEQKKQTMGEQKLNQERIGGEGADLKGLDPDPSSHSAVLEEGMTPHCNRQHKPDPTMRNEGFTVGIPDKWKSKQGDLLDTVTNRANEETKLKGDDPDSPTLLMNKRKGKPYRDKTRVSMVEDVPPFMTIYPQ